MKTIFEKTSINGFIARIEKLEDKKQGQWGKMTPFQMVKHCILSEQMYLGKTKYKRLFIGRLFGKIALKANLKNGDPMKKNNPTHPTFKITGVGDLEQQKRQWIDLIKEYGRKLEADFNTFTHPFFGKMTKEQIGVYVYKHTDHHLRQFGV